MPPMVTAFGGGLFVQDMHSRWFAVPETIECENSHASFQFTHLMHFSGMSRSGTLPVPVEYDTTQLYCDDFSISTVRYYNYIQPTYTILYQVPYY